METNKTVENIFTYLSESKQVQSMIDITRSNRPAMEAIIEDLERTFPFNEEFDMEFNYRNRQIIGSMIRFIMGHYGYRAGKSVKMKKGGFVKSAIVFKRF